MAEEKRKQLLESISIAYRSAISSKKKAIEAQKKFPISPIPLVHQLMAENQKQLTILIKFIAENVEFKS